MTLRGSLWAVLFLTLAIVASGCGPTDYYYPSTVPEAAPNNLYYANCKISVAICTVP